MKKKIVFVIPFFLLLVGLYLMPIAVFETNLSKMPGDLGDTRFNNYILEHGHKYFTGKIDNYWDAPFLYPYKNVTALSDNLLGTLPIYVVFRSGGADRETAFQLWLLSLFALNFICCFIALNSWSKNVVLSSVGAYVFAFSIYNLGQLDHVQVFPKFIAPLVLFWFWKFLSERKIKYFLFTSLGLIYQFYCGMYLAFMLSYILLFFGIAYFAIYRDRSWLNEFKNKKQLIYFASIIGLSVVLLLPLLKPYLEVAGSMGMRKFEAAINSIPRPRSYFFASEASTTWNFLSKHSVGLFPDWWGHHLFFGAIPWLGLIAGIYLLVSKKISVEYKKFVCFLFISVFFSVVFCLNFHGVTLYKLIFMLPGFSSMRAIDRFINMEVLLFIALFVLTLNKLYDIFPRVKYFVLCLPVLVVMDNLFDTAKVKRFDKQMSQGRIAAVKNQIVEQYDSGFSAIAYMPFLTHVENESDGYLNIVATQLDVMTASQELNIPCVNSYTGFDPGNYLNYFFEPRDRTLKEWCEYNHYNSAQIQTINDLGKKEVSREKINLLAYNNKFLTAVQDEEPLIYANREKAASWENFIMVRFENGECLIKASTNLLWSTEIAKEGKILASKSQVSEWEKFHIIELNDSILSLKAANGLYLSVETLNLKVFAQSPIVGQTELYKIVKL